ncbi:MAG: FAD-binding protein [Chloroflexi bacterium]|nr:FAD-binding protein [Chloroflexota bacterium]
MSNQLLDELVHNLGRTLDGEIRTDKATRILYSTDASIYQIEPLGVVIPRTIDDLQATVEAANNYGIPLLPRGSGSSLAGQTVGAALVIDFSRYLNKIIEINPETETAIVEPGVVLDTFNSRASKYGLKYGPDPASSDRATFGGMVGNNSTGAHSILYGMTSDNITALDVIMADGSQSKLQDIPLAIAKKRVGIQGLEGSLYSSALSIRERYPDLIRERWPRTWRRSSGYSINYLIPWSHSRPSQWGAAAYPPQKDGQINLAPLLVGSEGTLCVFQKITIQLKPVPRQTMLGVLAFNNIAAACDATPAILESGPSAVELISQSLVRRARAVPAYANKLSFVRGDPAALLVVEFSGNNQQKLKEQVQHLGSSAVVVETPAEQEQIWAVRKVGLGLLMSRPGNTKPLPFIEDVAVPVERLGDFVREFESILEAYATEGDFYAHASAGCLHMRPLINLKSEEGLHALREISREVVDLALRMGGALSGEHGDGLARSEWLENIYGSEIVAAFKELKQAADPKGIFNPGKIIDSQPMDSNLRYTPEYQVHAWDTTLDFSEQDSLAGAIEMCNGAGVCRQKNGLMCPSFQALNEEEHSTRGRANLLRAMISGNSTLNKINEKRVFEALDQCLECKACKAECPSAVDMAKLKYEFLQNYYRNNRRPLRDYLFANIATIAKLGRPFALIANFLLSKDSIWVLGGRSLGLATNRKLPKIKPKSINKISDLTDSTYREEVIFLRDAFTEYFYPEIGNSALQILERLECKVYILPVIGAGRTFISRGFLTQARKHAERVLENIKRIDPGGQMAIVGIEPSEIYTLRDEYLDFFPEDSDVLNVAARTFMIDEFLVRPNLRGISRMESLKPTINLESKGIQIFLHGHCYQKIQPPTADGFAVGVEATLEMLEALGYQPSLIEAGCCGMAGSFGYEADHYDLSMQIGEMKLFPAVREIKPDIQILATGFSCRAQIEDGTGRKPIHPIQLLYAN